MKIEIDFDENSENESKLTKLAEAGFFEILQLPREKLLGLKSDYGYGCALYVMAEKGYVELVKGLRKYDPKCQRENKVLIKLGYTLWYEKKGTLNDFQPIIDHIGFENLHICHDDQRSFLHILGLMGDIRILEHPSILDPELRDSWGSLPIFYLYENAGKDDVDKLMKYEYAITCLERLREKPRTKKIHIFTGEEKQDHNVTQIPLHHMIKNKNRPAAKDVMAYFKIKKRKYNYDRKLSSKLLEAILDRPKSLRFIQED